ncbi:hypothetical protein T310_7825 [Rasamsonia emersonii CBS 393.64]|uniref:Uncharacterized protein n=1 Tax=Rasamsonia emersonii (strain ATCC 16479 / CBS 393.64 / IMI 116815) TaxID=1408163 RepID=A0A0F4YIY3_RASE3|nr:hypothetical protein T310_7825 [Rasamsonia emersonii CBS 393.64]KKA18232.1 hypothetical protein T310_7825 [Rasamsonia emersonii CBS 393.64]
MKDPGRAGAFFLSLLCQLTLPNHISARNASTTKVVFVCVQKGLSLLSIERTRKEITAISHSLPNTCQCRQPSHNHLNKALATKSLAANKLLIFKASKEVEDSRNKENHSSSDQAGCARDKAEPLYGTHDHIDNRAHVVGCETADKRVKLGRGRADPEQEGNLDEDQNECRASAKAYYAKRNSQKGGEDVGNAQGEAEENAQDARPTWRPKSATEITKI